MGSGPTRRSRTLRPGHPPTHTNTPGASAIQMTDGSASSPRRTTAAIHKHANKVAVERDGAVRPSRASRKTLEAHRQRVGVYDCVTFWCCPRWGACAAVAHVGLLRPACPSLNRRPICRVAIVRQVPSPIYESLRCIGPSICASRFFPAVNPRPSRHRSAAGSGTGNASRSRV